MTMQMHNRINQTIYVAHDGQDPSDIVGVFLEDVEVRQYPLSPQPVNTSFQYTYVPYQYILLYGRTLLIHPINAPFQHIFSY